VWLCLGSRRGIGRASSSRPQGLWSAWTWGLAISGPTALAERGTTGLSAPNVLCRHTDLHAVWEAMVAWTIGATLRPSLTRLDLLARLFVCGLAAGVAATTAARAETQEHVYQAEPVGGILRIEGGDSLTARHLAELERRSATGRELLHRVERLPATVLIIRAYPLLVKTQGCTATVDSGSLTADYSGISGIRPSHWAMTDRSASSSTNSRMRSNLPV
jgi:hypothetical protein